MSELGATAGRTQVTTERTPVRLGGFASALLFLVGIASGVAVSSFISPPPPASPYAELSLVGEPPESAALVQVILADDARTLSRMVSSEVLRGLGQALDPLQEVFEAKFVGGTARKGDILAAYVLSGRSQTGEGLSVGAVFRVSGGKVIGVN